jgi:hypothetical protein
VCLFLQFSSFQASSLTPEAVMFGNPAILLFASRQQFGCFALRQLLDLAGVLALSRR